MANTVYSTIRMCASDDATNKVIDMVKSLPKSKFDFETAEIVKLFYSKSEILSDGYDPITENGIDIKWLNKWVGCKWLLIRFEDDVMIESAHVPNGFVVKLWSILSEIDPDAQINCNWTDESQAGTVYIKNGLCAESYQLIDDDVDSDDLYDVINELQDNAVSSCEEAIDTQDFDFPDVKMYKIANKKWEIVENITEVIS